MFNELIDMMLSYGTTDERDRLFCLDISWMTYLLFESKRVVLSDDILHVRTWRPGSSENSDNHSSKWLSSIVWSFDYLRNKGIDFESSTVFEESQLMWLFSLQRGKLGLECFREQDLENKRVKAFLDRPVCDKFRGE